MQGGYSDFEKAMARQKSYIGPAVITFILYGLFYIPGLIVNLLYMKDARRIAEIAGQKPSGYSCLKVLFILGVFPFIITILAILVLAGDKLKSAMPSLIPIFYSIF